LHATAQSVKLLIFSSSTVLIKKLMDALGGIKEIADSLIVVESVDYVSNVLGKVNLAVPLALKKLGGAIDKVGGEDAVKEAFLVCLIHLLKTVAEKTEGSKYEDAVCTSLLKLLCNVDNGASRGDHIVNDDNVLTGEIAAKKLVSLNGVHTVYDNGIIAALIERTEIKAESGGIIHTTAHSALVGRYDHKVIAVDLDIGNGLDKSFDHLIGGTYVVKSTERNSILNSGIVSVKGDNVGNAHVDKLLQRGSTVKRLAGGSVMLTSAIKHGHNYGNSAGLTADSADNSLKIAIVIVGAHGNGLTVHLVGNTVIEAVNDNVNVVTAHRLTNEAFAFAGTETGAIGFNDEAFIFYVPAPFLKIIINFSGKLLSSLHSYDAKLTVQIIVHTSSVL